MTMNPTNKTKDALFSYVRGDLKFFPYKLFLKILLVHAGVAALTLLFCPQFGIRLFSDSLGLMGFFMRFGSQACAVFCGAFFLGSSAVFLSVILEPGELLYLQHRRYAIFTGLAIISLAIFAVIAETTLLLMSLEYTLLWLIAAVSFGSGFTHLGYRLRNY